MSVSKLSGTSGTSGTSGIRIVLTGLWIGLWLGALLVTGWGIFYCSTHHPIVQDYYGWAMWGFWQAVSFGPLVLIIIRYWKWVLTICWLALGWHELKRLDKTMELFAGLWIGHKLAQPGTQVALGNYWNWLVTAPAGPGSMSSAKRSLLRVASILGLALYLLAVSWHYQQYTQFQKTFVEQRIELEQSEGLR